MNKCPVCDGELEEIVQKDDTAIFKCKRCEAKIFIAEQFKCSKCGGQLLGISTNNEAVTVCSKCGETERIDVNLDNEDKKDNDNEDVTIFSFFLFIIMLIILIAYSVITIFFWNCFNLIIFIILLIITIWSFTWLISNSAKNLSKYAY